MQSGRTTRGKPGTSTASRLPRYIQRCFLLTVMYQHDLTIQLIPKRKEGNGMKNQLTSQRKLPQPVDPIRGKREHRWREQHILYGFTGFRTNDRRRHQPSFLFSSLRVSALRVTPCVYNYRLDNRPNRPNGPIDYRIRCSQSQIVDTLRNPGIWDWALFLSFSFYFIRSCLVRV